MADNLCSMCKYYQPDTPAPGGVAVTTGTCHLYPPAINISRGQSAHNTTWPDVEADGWCGQWKRIGT